MSLARRRQYMWTRARGPVDSDPSRVILDTPTPSDAERSLATVLENLSTLQGEISTLSNRLQGTDFKSTEPVDKGFSKYLPAPFTGDLTENINEFLEKFNTYCDFVRYDDAKRCDLLPMLLTGRALSWFRSLPGLGGRGTKLKSQSRTNMVQLLSAMFNNPSYWKRYKVPQNR